jgi:hypothetical protein
MQKDVRASIKATWGSAANLRLIFHTTGQAVWNTVVYY